MLKFFLTILISTCHYYGNAFVIPSNSNKAPMSLSSRQRQLSPPPLFLSDDSNNTEDSNVSPDDRLRALGYSEDEIRRSNQADVPPPPTVRVDIVDGVDAATLTAVGFGLIAFNFFVLANAGDGGIGGVVATIMNTWNN